jgi:hypothetical protein
LNSQEILEQIDNEIARLQQVKTLLQGSGASRPSITVRSSQDGVLAPRRKKKRVLSEEARKKIAAAQRRRWANVRKAQTK